MSTSFDQNPENQQYGEPPQFGAPPVPQVPPQPQQQPQQPGAAAWGQPTQPYPDPNANPYAQGNPYQQPYAGIPTPLKPVKQRGGARFFAILFGSVLGRIVIGLLVAGSLAIFHYATADNAKRDSSGQVSQAGSLQANDLRVGDCFDAPTGALTISSVKAIPCTQAHDSQVYDEPLIAESSFPGVSTLRTEGQTSCNTDQSAISSTAPSSLQVEIYYPQDDATFAQQDYFICSLSSSSPDLTQSYVS